MGIKIDNQGSTLTGAADLPNRSDATKVQHPTDSFVAATELSRHDKYNAFITENVKTIQNYWTDSTHDRGLFVSPLPLSLRDITEGLLRDFLDGHMPVRFQGKDVLLVVQGKENKDRWQKRLEGLFGKRLFGLNEKELWEKNNVRVHLASIHELTQMSRLGGYLEKMGLIILDKEHHIRPIVDKENEERARFIRVWTQGKFLSRTFDRTFHPDSFMLGLTETVTENARNIYGEGLIAAHRLPDLLARGIIAKPEVRVILPKTNSDTESWLEIPVEERVEQELEIRNQILHDITKQRTVSYTGSRNYAEWLTLNLEDNPALQNKVALAITGSKELDTRRAEETKAFFSHHTKNTLVHVRTALEGVDEFQRNPVDVLFISAAEYVGSIQYGLQAIGAHLGSDHVPLIIDMGDLVRRHPDLVHFDPDIYTLEDGQLKKGSPINEYGPPRISGSSTQVEGLEILYIDLFGDDLAPTVKDFLGKQNINRARLAFSLCWTEDFLKEVVNGEILLGDRKMMEDLAQVLKLSEAQTTHLISAWAYDRLQIFLKQYPKPDSLSEREENVRQAIIWGLIRNKDHKIQGVADKTIWNYSSQGELPNNIHNKHGFFESLLTLIDGNESTSNWPGLGMAFGNIQLGRICTGDYCKPNSIHEFANSPINAMQSWFEALRNPATLYMPEEIIWQYIPKNKTDELINPYPTLRDKTNRDPDYGKLAIRRLKNGFQVFSASGSKALDVVGQLRLRKTEQGGIHLDIRSNGWLTMGTGAKNTFSLDDLNDLRLHDLHSLFDQLPPDSHGQRPSHIVWRFKSGHHEGQLSGLTPLLPSQDQTGLNYAKIHLSRLEDERIELTAAEGSGAYQFVDKLRQWKASQPDPISERVIIRSNGWLALKSQSRITLKPEDFNELRLSDLDSFFDELAENGVRPREIALNFITNKDGGLSEISPTLPEEKSKKNHSRIYIKQQSEMHFQISGVNGDNAFALADRLRLWKSKQPAAISDRLDIRTNGWLALKTNARQAFTLNDVEDLRLSDFEGFFADLTPSNKGIRPKHIVLQFDAQYSINGTVINLAGLESVLPEHKRTIRVYGKIHLFQNSDEIFQVTSIEGKGCLNFVKALREWQAQQPPEIASRLDIRSDGWLAMQTNSMPAFQIDDLDDIRASDIDSFFEQVTQANNGIRPSHILWQFIASRNNQLSKPTPVLPDKMRAESNFQHLSIKSLPNGHYEFSAYRPRSRVTNVLLRLNHHPLAQGPNPIFRIKL